MVKSVKSIFVVLAFSSFISLSFNEESVVNEKLSLGDQIPELVLQNEKQVLNLQSSNGKYTLLSFWAAYDANSRQLNAELSHKLQSSPNVKMISVSFDTYRSIYDAAMLQDGIGSAENHLETDGENSKAFKSFGLENGFKNYLLDSKGVIIATNVTANELSAYI